MIQTAIGGQAVTKMIEGEKEFDVTIRWPQHLRQDETAILDIPVDVVSHQVTSGSKATLGPTPVSGASKRGLDRDEQLAAVDHRQHAQHACRWKSRPRRASGFATW